MKAEKIVIGYSDYSRKEMESGKAFGGIGSMVSEWLESIKHYESIGYKVVFKSNIGIWILKGVKFKVIAIKKTENAK